MEINEDGLIPWTFEMNISVTVEVKNINDDYVNRARVEEAARAAALAELVRQMQEAIDEGAFDG